MSTEGEGLRIDPVAGSDVPERWKLPVNLHLTPGHISRISDARQVVTLYRGQEVVPGLRAPMCATKPDEPFVNLHCPNCCAAKSLWPGFSPQFSLPGLLVGNAWGGRGGLPFRRLACLLGHNLRINFRPNTFDLEWSALGLRGSG